jgi:hypothetical protein
MGGFMTHNNLRHHHPLTIALQPQLGALLWNPPISVHDSRNSRNAVELNLVREDGICSPVKGDRAMNPKFKHRFLILRKLHAHTDDTTEQCGMNIFSVGKEVGIGEVAAIDAFMYLEQEGLVKWTGLSGEGSITPLGIQEIEDAMAEKRTAYFPLGIADAL